MYRVSYLIVLYLLSTFSFALPEDSGKTLHIIADSTIFNYKSGLDTYEGHVKVDQGTTHLIADRLITQKNPQHKIILVTAFGVQRLAEYTTELKKGDPTLNAKAKIIRFYPLTSMVYLDDNVVVTQGENRFDGPHIVYNMKEQIVNAPASNQGRATIVIQPQQLKTS